MMILPLSDALMNCLQNLTSRIAGVDNEQMTSRVMGMGAMFGAGLGAIKEQFHLPSSKDGKNGGLKGFINRTKSFLNPTMNLTDERDYNGNINPIRDVKRKQGRGLHLTSRIDNNGNMNPIRDVLPKDKDNNMSAHLKKASKHIVNTGSAVSNVAKTYFDIGSKMAEGNIDKSSYLKNKKSNLQNTNLINNTKKLGDENEHKR